LTGGANVNAGLCEPQYGEQPTHNKHAIFSNISRTGAITSDPVRQPIETRE
jgi:hypothetical protein